jgi:hypothetical protein
MALHAVGAIRPTLLGSPVPRFAGKRELSGIGAAHYQRGAMLCPLRYSRSRILRGGVQTNAAF